MLAEEGEIGEGKLNAEAVRSCLAQNDRCRRSRRWRWRRWSWPASMNCSAVTDGGDAMSAPRDTRKS